MSNTNKRRYSEGCLCANWVDVEVSESRERESQQVSYQRKDLQTLLEELNEIRRNLEKLAEKQIFLENLMRINRGELLES